MVGIEDYFTDPKLKRTLAICIKLEVIVVGFTQFMSALLPYDPLMMNMFKNLVHFVH